MGFITPCIIGFRYGQEGEQVVLFSDLFLVVSDVGVSWEVECVFSRLHVCVCLHFEKDRKKWSWMVLGEEIWDGGGGEPGNHGENGSGRRWL